MQFKRMNEYYIQSGDYIICKSLVACMPIYTLTYQRNILKQDKKAQPLIDYAKLHKINNENA